MLSFILAVHCLFNPPSDWEIADPKMPSKRVLVGFVNKQKSGFCPSMNLTCEKIKIQPDEYLTIIQKNCKAKKQNWRHLGKIETQSGPAELIEIETRTPLGQIRLLQTILFKDGEAFILTVGANKKDFGKFSEAIEKSFRSMRLCLDLFEMIEDENTRASLYSSWQKRKEDLESFQKKVLEQKKLGSVWQILMLKS